jgi:hypothetical protein
MIQMLQTDQRANDDADDSSSHSSWKSSPPSHDVVFFFFFDDARKDTLTPGSCLRAVLDQLVALPERQQYALQLYSLMRSGKRAKPLKSTDEDVSNMLQLVLQTEGSCVLIIDGLDQCTQPDAHLQSLVKFAASSTRLGVAIFSRPSVRLPRSISELSLKIDFQSMHNAQDIAKLLKYQISDLDETYQFLKPENFDTTVMQILHRSEGMFLWANLLMSYLGSPSLTNFDRQDAIRNLSRLEGLDSLFIAILEHLARPLSAKAKERIAKLFKWVALSAKSLTPTELSAAVAIPLDRAATKDDVIPHLGPSVGIISGALLEIGTDGTVRFVHQSVREFLTSNPSDLRPHSQFHIQASQANLEISYACLSYLHHTIPWEPLSGSSQVIPNPDVQRKRFPVLEYTAKYWPYHVSVLCLGYWKEKPTVCLPQFREFLDMFTQFIRNKPLMSLWIEATWMFGTAPSLQKLVEALNSIPKDAPVVTFIFESLIESRQYLEEFASDLELLSVTWPQVLEHSPNEIWEPSISGFYSPKFWKRIAGSVVKPVAQSRAKVIDSTLIHSQISDTGDKLGVLRVQPPP